MRKYSAGGKGFGSSSGRDYFAGEVWRSIFPLWTGLAFGVRRHCHTEVAPIQNKAMTT